MDRCSNEQRVGSGAAGVSPLENTLLSRWGRPETHQSRSPTLQMASDASTLSGPGLLQRRFAALIHYDDAETQPSPSSSFSLPLRATTMLPISRHEFRSGLRLTYLLRSFLKDVHSVASKFLSSRPGYLSGLFFVDSRTYRETSIL